MYLLTGTSAAFLATALILLNGCGSKQELQSNAADDSAGPTNPMSSGEEKVLNLYSWSDYFDPAVLQQFTEETGIRINYDTLDSNEILETKLLAGNSGYDVVTPANLFIEVQIEAGLHQKLDRTRIPNWGNLDPRILQKVSKHDPGNEHSVVYMWGTDGIGYNEEMVKARLPDAPVTSWRLVFDPTIASKFKDCGIAMIDSAGDVIPLVLAYLGKNPGSESEEDLGLAMETLMAIRPYIRMIESTQYPDALATGEICIAVGWSNHVLQARDRAIEAGNRHVIRYSIPEEGTFGWFDMLAIPKDAPHPDNAHGFINFLQRADVAAANSTFVKSANGNAASYDLIDPSIRNDAAIYPPAETAAELFPGIVESEQHLRRMNRSWTRFVGGG